MRTRTFLPALVLSGGWLAAPAAAAQAPADSATHKHELGLTASPVLDKFFTANRALPVGLLYKRRLAPGRYLRLGAQGQYSRTRRDDPYWPTVNDDFDQRTAALELSAGLEWARPLGRRWALAAGADAGAGYRRQYAYRLSFNLGETGVRDAAGNPVAVYEESRNTFTRRALFVRPFAAVRFRLAPRLYASAEAGPTASHSRFQINTDVKRVRTDTNEAFVTSYSNPLTVDYNTEVQLQLIRQVTLHYCFGR